MLMGVDGLADGRLLITTEIAVPRGMGGGKMGGGGGGASGTSAAIISGEGKDVLEAIEKIEYISSRDLTTTHMSFVILGEDFAKSDVGPIIDIFSRNLEYRHNTLVAVCQGRAVDFLNEFSSVEETEPSQYINKLVTTSYSELGVCPVVTMHEFMVGYNTIAIEPWAPYLGLASLAPAEKPEDGQAGKSSGTSSGGTSGAPSQPPGKVVKILGTAVFRKVGQAQRMVDYLDVEESMGALLLNGTLNGGYLNIAHPVDQAETTLHLHHESTSTKLTLDDRSAKATVTIRVTASVDESQVSSEGGEDGQETIKAVVYTAQDQLVALLDKTFRKLTDLGSDVIGLGHEAQAHFKSYQDWEAYDWRSVFQRTEASFDVKLHLLTGGFTISRPYPR